MTAKPRELALEIVLFAAFFLILSFPLLGVLISFPMVVAEYTDDMVLTEAEKTFYQPRLYFLIFLSLAVSMITLVFVACAVRFLVGKSRDERPPPPPS